MQRDVCARMCLCADTQDAPLDLDYPPLFYTQRAHFIEERLQEIAVAGVFGRHVDEIFARC